MSTINTRNNISIFCDKSAVNMLVHVIGSIKKPEKSNFFLRLFTYVMAVLLFLTLRKVPENIAKDKGKD